MMADLLQAVVAAARRSAMERERARAVAAPRVDDGVRVRAPRGVDFRDGLRSPGVRIIAECKRRSPLAGVLRADYAPADIARGYQAGGAAAISVLTERTFFDGSLDDLRAVRAAVSLPVLCKDFLVTPFQVHEAAAAGADAVLLIVAALDEATLKTLLNEAQARGLAVLVEVHTEDELRRALDAGANIVGVNSRDLRTLEVKTSVFDALAPLMPGHVVAVAESGLKTPEEIARLRGMGYKAFLIGERLMAESDPAAALSALRLAASDSGGTGASRRGQA
jgi:indole-3-glycerol phosphate synthase